MSLHESFPLSLKQILAGVRKESKDRPRGRGFWEKPLHVFLHWLKWSNTPNRILRHLMYSLGTWFLFIISSGNFKTPPHPFSKIFLNDWGIPLSFLGLVWDDGFSRPLRSIKALVLQIFWLCLAPPEYCGPLRGRLRSFFRSRRRKAVISLNPFPTGIGYHHPHTGTCTVSLSAHSHVRTTQVSPSGSPPSEPQGSRLRPVCIVHCFLLSS